MMSAMTITLREADGELTAPGGMFAVDETDIRGVPTKVWLNAPPSLRSVFEGSRGHGDKDFLVYEDHRTTFEEHYHQAAHLATRLVDDFGVVKGDRIAIAMRNFPEWVVAFWGCLLNGTIVVPLDYRASGAFVSLGSEFQCTG